MRTFSLLVFLISMITLLSSIGVLAQIPSGDAPDQAQKVYLPFIAAGSEGEAANSSRQLAVDPNSGNLTLEIAIPGKTGLKRSDSARVSAASGLPSKDDVNQIGAISSEMDMTNVKPMGEAAHLQSSQAGKSGKTMPDQTSAITGRGAQLARQVTSANAQLTEQYVRLVLHIDQNGVQVKKFLAVPGHLLESTMILGDFFYTAQINGQTVSLGSLQNPLELRSYAADGNHTTQSAQAATFVISLPAAFLDENNLRSASLEFFQVKEMEEVAGASISVETLTDLASHLDPITKISSGELVEAYTQRN